ncbi:PREDICTED: uncharacterized protein LOC109115678 [Nelumbo nucifera]|uniref:Uncharacterized protein LOC109115678 n=1 Tax=Nelumbo nucifera TaxID=4432 RepID=A0A1U8Q9G7_NELNU|nr:PREDICTED: uncharacterized protein LOC109115678 [Nelumbo nucifera]
MGFKATKSNSSLFIFPTNNISLYALIYVDDLLVTRNNVMLFLTSSHNLPPSLPSKTLALFTIFWALKLNSLLQDFSFHSKSILQMFCILARWKDANQSPLPYRQTSLSLFEYDSTPLEDPTRYCSIVGSLQYATTTRPNNAFSVNKDF